MARVGGTATAKQTAAMHERHWRMREHGLACGHEFKVTAFEASDTAAHVTVANTGVAPIYYEAFVAVNEVRAEESLKGLLPGEERRFIVASGGTNPKLTIECDRLVPGQRIEFDADVSTTVLPANASEPFQHR